MRKLIALMSLCCLAIMGLSSHAIAQELNKVDKGHAYAIFAGGCFWCMEKPFDKLDGVISTTSGYSGGHIKNPSYKAVVSGYTGHYEVVKVVYDPEQISYDKLVEVFWKNIDPLDDRGQFCDKGKQYLSAIFYANDDQKGIAEESLNGLKASKRFKKPIATTILPAKTFYAAEGYHQNYYERNPIRYTYYRRACGRDKRLKQLWGS